MARPYATDLRERVLTACEAGEGSQAEVAGRYRVGERTLSGWLRAAREEGRRAPKPRGGGRAPAFDAEAAVRLRAAVRADDDATLEELGRAAGVSCCASAVHRALARLGITRKKSRGGRPSRTARS
jgi:transposase